MLFCDKFAESRFSILDLVFLLFAFCSLKSIIFRWKKNILMSKEKIQRSYQNRGQEIQNMESEKPRTRDFL